MKVLYILGSGRSGSTLLDLTLGEIEGFFSAGELSSVWRRGLGIEGWPCGCGRTLVECPVWKGVFDDVGPPRGPAPVDVARWQKRVVRERFTWRLLAQRRGRSSDWTDLERYSLAAAALYSAIQRVTGARIIVDSSKAPSDAALLALLPNVDPYYVALVRDPRAAVYSWHRIPRNGTAQGKLASMGSARTAARWLLRYAGVEALICTKGRGRSVLVRYEDFVARPRETVAAVTDLVQERNRDDPFVDDRTIRLRENHTASGNRIRFHQGNITLRRDDEWLDRQSRRDQIVTTAITMPFLRRYGYPLRVRKDHTA